MFESQPKPPAERGNRSGKTEPAGHFFGEDELYCYGDDALRFPGRAESQPELLAEKGSGSGRSGAAAQFFDEGELCCYEDDVLRLPEAKIHPGSRDFGIEEKPACPSEPSPADYREERFLPNAPDFWELFRYSMARSPFLSKERLGWDRAVGKTGFICFLGILFAFSSGMIQTFYGRALIPLTVFVFFLWAAGLYHVLHYRNARRLHFLLTRGRRTEGMLVRRRRGKRTLPLGFYRRQQIGGWWLEAAWRFEDEKGKLREKEVCYQVDSGCDAPEGSMGYVYYDPANPEESVWIGDDWKKYSLYFEPERFAARRESGR